MICSNCGKTIPDNSRFCDGCGGVQVPEKPKKSKKGLIIGICAVLVVLIAAAAVYLLIPKTETVYVLKSYTMINPDGSRQEFKYRFDEYGNPTRLFSMALYRQMEAEYDDQGNLTERTWYSLSDEDRKYGSTSEYKYSYDDDGRIETCREYYNDQKVAVWDFTWDKRGNLTQVILDGKADYSTKIVRQDWEYDKKDRLVTEYVCIAIFRNPVEAAEFSVYRCDYTYDDAGNLESYEYARTEELVKDFEDLDYTDLNFEDEIYYRFTYHSDGKILTSETNYNGDVSENEYDYDSNGNLDFWDAYEYDEHGNLLWTDSEAGYRCELEYEAVELSKEAAQRYYRWESLYAMNPPKTYCYPMVSFANQSDMFYYYLIPNPVW